MGLNHVGIIMDGNRRYAKKHFLNPLKGHVEGAKRINDVVEVCLEKSIKEVSLYTFSTKNFGRGEKEVDFLFNLFEEKFNELKNKNSKDVKVIFAGKKELFPMNLQKIMIDIEEKTKDNSKLTINFCMGYDGQEEIINSINDCISKDLELTKENINDNLWVKTPIDLIIRTSGENRTSGFLLWQSSYAEFYFSDVLWPEFNKQELYKAINEFNNRNRRFGK